MQTGSFRNRTVFFSFGLCLGASSVGPMYAAGPFSGFDVAVVSTCRVDSVAGIYNQTLFTYNVQGDCQVSSHTPDRRGGSTFPDVVDAFNWKAVGTYDPAKYIATETISVSRPSSTTFTVPVVATITGKMICAKDPWREPNGGSCGSVVPIQQTGSLGSYDSIVSRSFYATDPVVPRSSVLSAQQRAALNQEYQKYLARFTDKPKPAVNNPLAVWPTMIAPTVNSHAFEGRLQVRGTMPAGSYKGTEAVFVEFTWVDTPGTPKFVNVFNTSLQNLLNGIAVPAYITRSQFGRWQVHAKISSPAAGPFGPNVLFYLDKLPTTSVVTPSRLQAPK